LSISFMPLVSQFQNSSSRPIDHFHSQFHSEFGGVSPNHEHLDTGAQSWSPDMGNI
jgi:hypothetical protein